MNASDFSAVDLEVFKHLLASVCEEMGVRLQRSAFSTNIKERLDYSCAVFDDQGRMIAQAAHIPVHLGSTPASVQAVLQTFPIDTIQRGDRFIVNDPYAGGTHLPDITVVEPVLLPHEKRPAFFVCNRAHHADVGGSTPGSLPVSRSIEEEGLRIPPTRLDEAMIQQIAQASRTPDERRGDLLAQAAAMRVGVERLQQLCVDHGPARVRAAGQALQGYTARFIARMLDDAPDGRYRFEDVMDGDGFDAVDIRIVCELSIQGDRATLDFRDSDDQVAGPVNAVRAITLSAVNYALRCLCVQDIPANAGVLEPVDVLTRSGSVVDCVEPAAVAAGNVETSQRLVDVVFGALAQAFPGRVPAASQGTMNNLTYGGVDPRTGEAFAYYETIAGGAGANAELPGGDAVQVHMTNTRNTPIEALERQDPVVVESYAVREHSGGEGLNPGGQGLVRRYRFLAPATVTLLTERRTHRPWGLAGGGPGTAGENVLIRQNGNAVVLPGKVTLEVCAGDVLELRTPGGGGYGVAP